MGFKSLIEKQVQDAMQILGTDADGLARKQTYVSVVGGVYDPTTRRTSSTETDHTDVPMTLVRFKIDDMDDEVKPQTDRIALIAALDLTPVPDENDKIRMHNGEVYTVKRIMSDPADALYKLHVRRE